MSRNPTGRYKRQTLTFYAAPYKAPLRAFAVLVFPWRGDEVLLCEIADRGWCVPSGRVEPRETSAQAARRETLEEAGAVLGDLHYVGCYQIRERQEIRWADLYTAEVEDLVPIQAEEESRGRRFVTLEGLPELYHVWNPMTEIVFVQSLEAIRRARKLSE